MGVLSCMYEQLYAVRTYKIYILDTFLQTKVNAFKTISTAIQTLLY